MKYKAGSEKEGIPIRNNTCVLAYAGNQPFNFPEKGHLLAPWVAIDFVDYQNHSNNAAITVSNRSSLATDPENCAVIKSFEFGHSDGMSVRVVIHDTQGGSFNEFMKHLMKDWLCLKNVNPGALLMKFQFGWVKSGCNIPLPYASSPEYHAMCDSVETSFTEGKFIYEVTGKDITSRVLEGGAELQKGGEGQEGVHLLHAVQELICDSMAPNVSKVSFKSVHGTSVISSPTGGQASFFSPKLFLGDTAKERQLGPKGKWDAKGQNKLEAVRRWVEEARSYKGHGWLAQYDPSTPGGELVFWEDTKLICKDESDSYWESSNIGTFLVNGSGSSPVIEFNPKIRWDFATVTAVGGQMGDDKKNGMGTDGAKNPGAECMPKDKLEGAGQVQQTNPSDGKRDRSGANAVKDSAEDDAVAKKTITLSSGNVAADLVIVGDPVMCPPFEAMGTKNVTIVMINPFHISPDGNSCGEWLATPQCNTLLSNKAWLVRSVVHKIDAGSYTTTLGVELSVPGIHFPSGNSLGGWTGGWKPGGVC